MTSAVRSILLSVLILTVATAAWAQWSSDPFQNLALSNIAGADQVQPKVLPLPDNSWYVSWFNNNPNDPPPNGYDVYYQLLSPSGVEQFPHDGVQVAKLTLSSTEDYGLDADANGNALLAFLDDRTNPDNPQVTAAKMSPTGQPLWGASGVALTFGPNFHGQPKIAATSDGNIVVAWVSDSSVVLQKLDPNGHPLWVGSNAPQQRSYARRVRLQLFSGRHARLRQRLGHRFLGAQQGFRQQQLSLRQQDFGRGHCCGAQDT